MTLVLTVIHVTICFVLIAVILLQPGRGQGLSGASFGSGNVQSLLGTRAADFLTKATTVTAICFLLTSIGLDFIEAHRSRSLLQGIGSTSTIDVDAIKKALDKIKTEGMAGDAEQTQAASVAAETFTDEIPAAEFPE